ncbi:unnamed protein product [Calypogeia fissa]
MSVDDDTHSRLLRSRSSFSPCLRGLVSDFLSSTARAFLRYVAEPGNVISSSIIQQHRMSDSRDTVPSTRNLTAERPC